MRPDPTPIQSAGLAARLAAGPAAPVRAPGLDDAPSEAELCRRAGRDFERAANTFELMVGVADAR